MSNKFKEIILTVAAVYTLTFATFSMAISDISGSGASFPYPVYAKWSEAYKTQNHAELRYQPLGSELGIAQIKQKKVDVGATDKPLTTAELDKLGLFQFPAIIGGVVPVVNIKGLPAGRLKLSGEVLADIFLGKITKWNDQRIVAENQDLNLPNKSILVVTHAAGSGTTFIFTNYLSKVSADWKTQIGEGKTVSGLGISGKGHQQVVSFLKRGNNSISYVEYAYALQNKLSTVQMKNRDGYFVKPGSDSFKAASANATWEADKGFYETMTDQPGQDSWPITGASYILIRKTQESTSIGKSILGFFDWAYTNGDNIASDLGYVPISEKDTNSIREAWRKQIRDSKDNPIWE